MRSQRSARWSQPAATFRARRAVRRRARTRGEAARIVVCRRPAPTGVVPASATGAPVASTDSIEAVATVETALAAAVG